MTVQATLRRPRPIHFRMARGPLSGFLATPDKPGRYPALVVIHEWWGLTDWVKEETQKLAEQGYVALAVDFIAGR